MPFTILFTDKGVAMFLEQNSTTSLFSQSLLHESPMGKNTTVVFIGNPLSSLCWAHRSIIQEIQRYCSDRNINFSILMGYLKQETFKKNTFIASFVKNDTEPACRAIAAARILLLQEDHNDTTLLQFFTSIQEKFFEQKEDATRTGFYKSICKTHHLSYDEFADIFNIISTDVEFNTTKKLGISCYPNLILDQLGTIHPLASESISFENIITAIDSFL